MSSLIRKGLLPTGLVLVMLAVVVALVAMLGARDQASGSHGPLHPVNQFAAKFICGDIPSPADDFKALAPGQYNTAVNIHNPNNFIVQIQKKAVVGIAEPGQGRPSARQTHQLLPDADMDVDCFEINQLLNIDANGDGIPDGDVCPLDPGTTSLAFCKGTLVIEAATQTAVGGSVPAQLDVTDIITVKEEHFLWKDYTWEYRGLVPLPCVVLPFCTEPQIFPNIPYNWPVPPQPQPQCYKDGSDCPFYNTVSQISQAISVACGGCVFNQTDVFLREADFTTDARDVSLDFEFVTPKRVTYPCWPKGLPGCP